MSLDAPIPDEDLLRIAMERQQRKNNRAALRELKYEEPKPIKAVARTNLPDRYVGMNQWERKRAEELDAMVRRGEIAAWWGGKATGITLKLAFDTRYTPDFLIQELDGSLRLEEVKGFWRDDAKVKTNVCADKYPFPISVLTKEKGQSGWTITPVYPASEEK